MADVDEPGRPVEDDARESIVDKLKEGVKDVLTSDEEDPAAPPPDASAERTDPVRDKPGVSPVVDPHTIRG